MRGLKFLTALLVFLILTTSVSAPSESYQWVRYCEGLRDLVRSKVPHDQRKYFLSFSHSELAAKLRPSLSTVIYSTTPIILSGPDGRQFTIRAGRASTSHKTLIVIREGEQEVASFSFQIEDQGKSAFMHIMEVNEKHAGQGAGELMRGMMVSLLPDLKRARSHFAWTNFQKVAEALAGEPVREEKDAEKIVATALKTNPAALKAAVLSAPTGKMMSRLGFDVDPASFDVYPAAETEGDGPILVTEWSRNAEPLGVTAK